MAEPRDTDAVFERGSSRFDTNKSRQKCQKKSIYVDITELSKKSIYSDIMQTDYEKKTLSKNT